MELISLNYQWYLLNDDTPILASMNLGWRMKIISAWVCSLACKKNPSQWPITKSCCGHPSRIHHHVPILYNTKAGMSPFCHCYMLHWKLNSSSANMCARIDLCWDSVACYELLIVFLLKRFNIGVEIEMSNKIKLWEFKVNSKQKKALIHILECVGRILVS